MSNTHSTSPAILFVDDEAATTKYFQLAINSIAPVITASSVEEGKRALDANAQTLLVLVSDQRMPGEYGNELLRYAKERYPHIIRILATAYSELENTVEAINEGQIHRYLKKPLDLNSLRIELKQVLEFAYLRKERDELVREKLMVQHNQIIAHRIGALHSLIATVNGTVGQAFESYLTIALAAGITPPQPDWLLMDYSDLVSAEAQRNGELGAALRDRLAQLEQQSTDYSPSASLNLLNELLDSKLIIAAPDKATLVDDRFLAEYLETACTVAVSDTHISLLAFLLWYERHNGAVKISNTGSALEIHLTELPQNLSFTPLATWIEQF